MTPLSPISAGCTLLHAELLTELAAAGFSVDSGTAGENVLTRGADLLELPTGSHLRLRQNDDHTGA